MINSGRVQTAGVRLIRHDPSERLSETRSEPLNSVSALLRR